MWSIPDRSGSSLTSLRFLARFGCQDDADWPRRPADAVEFARAGQTHAVMPDSCVRLAAIEARALARIGEPGAAVLAIERAQRARERSGQDDELATFGGVLTFPLAKQLYYASGTLAVAEYPDAERLALEAIDMYATGPFEQRSYGDEALGSTSLPHGCSAATWKAPVRRWVPFSTFLASNASGSSATGSHASGPASSCRASVAPPRAASWSAQSTTSPVEPRRCRHYRRAGDHRPR